uniref:Ig-like domain-containing protein n=1 Tax=Cyprinus carpio TaxID=7962 RepID=A0A8C2IIC5_CYPCA
MKLTYTLPFKQLFREKNIFSPLSLTASDHIANSISFRHLAWFCVSWTTSSYAPLLQSADVHAWAYFRHSLKNRMIMKTLLLFFPVVLLMCGVFDADADEVKSVMEGDSVTLNPNLSQIQGFIEILWRFGEKGFTIAQTDGNKTSYEDYEVFRGRLQLNQNGSLTITNVRTNHSGLYEAEIRHKTGTSNQKFSITVYESPSVIAGAEAEMKLMSVKEGDPVTLHVPQIQGNELIVWRFGDEEELIVKADTEAKSSSLYYETDERFRDRLKLNDQTGSLTITNTRTTDSGLYKVKISSNKQTLYKRFIVTVSERGLSGGAVAGILVGVLLLAAAAAGVIYFYRRPRTTNLPSQMWTVPTADDVPLNPDTEIQTGDEILWLFGYKDALIAEIKGETREMTTHEGPDEIFKNRLKLDEMTGSLTIKFIFTEHTGLYTLKIRRGRETLKKKFHVSVSEREIRAVEGNPVTLHPDTAIQKGDEIQWLFDDKEQTVLAEIKNTKVTKYDDWRFGDRLELMETGSLTIKNLTAAHNGYYTLKITRGRDKIYKRFYIYAKEWKITVMEGESVTLEPAYEIKKDDVIQCLFGDEEQQTLIAEFIGKAREIFIYDDVADERFRDILELDETTGSLTITNTRTEHSGVYRLQIRSSSGVSEQTFIVTVRDKVEEKFLEEDSVTLKPDTKIQRDDQILWMFGDQDKLIAQMKGGTVDIYDDVNKRFRGRLKLDKMTGSLTITKIETKHTGLYKLQIISSRGTLYKKFKVSIQPRYVAVTAGDSVHLNTDLTEIHTDDEIQWRFGDENSLIAEIKGGTGVTHDGPDERFRDRLELDETTGDLTIKNSTDEHTGRYKLKICSSEGNTNRTYIVIIRCEYLQ